MQCSSLYTNSTTPSPRIKLSLFNKAVMRSSSSSSEMSMGLLDDWSVLGFCVGERWNYWTNEWTNEMMNEYRNKGGREGRRDGRMEGRKKRKGGRKKECQNARWEGQCHCFLAWIFSYPLLWLYGAGGKQAKFLMWAYGTSCLGLLGALVGRLIGGLLGLLPTGLSGRRPSRVTFTDFPQFLSLAASCSSCLAWICSRWTLKTKQRKVKKAIWWIPQ